MHFNYGDGSFWLTTWSYDQMLFNSHAHGTQGIYLEDGVWWTQRGTYRVIGGSWKVVLDRMLLEFVRLDYA